MPLPFVWGWKRESKQIGERRGYRFEDQKVNDEVINVGMTVLYACKHTEVEQIDLSDFTSFSLALLCPGQGEPKPEGGTLAGRTAHANLSLMPLNQHSGDI